MWCSNILIVFPYLHHLQSSKMCGKYLTRTNETILRTNVISLARKGCCTTAMRSDGLPVARELYLITDGGGNCKYVGKYLF